MSQRYLYLNLSLLGAGHHPGATNHPSSHASRRFALDFWIDLATRAETAGFDSLLVGDGTAQRFGSDGFGLLEPFTLLAALAVHTQRIGLVAPVSSTYHAPYHAARKLAALDHISGGRAGWHLLPTSSVEDNSNFGSSASDSASDRERASEFVVLLHELWDSWEDAAPVYDKARGVLSDVNKIRVINHRGTSFSVEGPLNAPRPPQGYPVLLHSRPQGPDDELAMATADAILGSFASLQEAQAFSQSIRKRAKATGRDPRDTKIFASLPFLVAEREEKAHQLQAELDEAIAEELRHARLLEPNPLQHPLETYWNLEAESLSSGNNTFDDLFVGTPNQLADHIEAWFGSGAIDGFDLLPALSEQGTNILADHVVPELRRRGLLRAEYAGTSRTLREHLGLPRPANSVFTPLRLAA